MLLDLPEEVLELVMHQLGIVSGNLGPLMNASAVSKQLALACEVCFERECREHRWRPPRMPRGAAAEHHCFPWRTLYRQHACRACGACGDFPVRNSQAAPMQFLLCRSCVDAAWVRSRLVKGSHMVDEEGLSGRKLLTIRRKGPHMRRRPIVRR